MFDKIGNNSSFYDFTVNAKSNIKDIQVEEFFNSEILFSSQKTDSFEKNNNVLDSLEDILISKETFPKAFLNKANNFISNVQNVIFSDAAMSIANDVVDLYVDRSEKFYSELSSAKTSNEIEALLPKAPASSEFLGSVNYLNSKLETVLTDLYSQLSKCENQEEREAILRKIDQEHIMYKEQLGKLENAQKKVSNLLYLLENKYGLSLPSDCDVSNIKKTLSEYFQNQINQMYEKLDNAKNVEEMEAILKTIEFFQKVYSDIMKIKKL